MAAELEEMTMAEGVFSRWSQRKTLARQGVVLPEPEVAPAPAVVVPSPPSATVLPPTEPEPAPAPLTMADVQALTPVSDFSPFVARTVSPEVRNAAMKKLFTDPHYNVMDRLDIYIDDYNLADPLPAKMLQQMVSAQFLKLVQTPTEQAASEPTTATPPEPPAPQPPKNDP